MSTGKNNTNKSDGNICINSSGSSLDTKQVIVDQVSNSDNYNNGLMSDNSGVIQNMVLESKVVSRESVDEMGSVCVAVSYTHLSSVSTKDLSLGGGRTLILSTKG